MIENVIYNDSLLAIIVRSNFNKPNINFFTPDNFSQQLAYMQHPVGKTIQPHLHNPVAREVYFTQEILLIRRGKLRVDFYNEQQVYIESYVLEAGDVILLASGGHGFEVLEELEMFEVKQGPYTGDNDKIRFKSIEASKIIVRE